MTGRRPLAGLLLLLALAGCSSDDPPVAEPPLPPSPTFSATPTTPAPPPSLRRPHRPDARAGHRAAAVARHPAVAAAAGRLRPGPADPAGARPAPVHAAGHARAAARRRVRLRGREGPRRRPRPVHLGCRLPGRRRRPGLRAADVLGLRRPAAHRRAAAQPHGRGRRGRRVPHALRAAVPVRGAPGHAALRARRAPDRRRQQHRVLRLPADDRIDHDVQPARLRPGHRPRPVPEPLRARTTWSCPSWRRPISTATTSGPG